MSFIHFGCWNKNFCDPREKNINGLSQVMNSLIYNEKTPTFYIINGDNFYPNKIDGKKFYSKKNMDSGFECLKELRKKALVYILMGNHDLQFEKKMYDANTREPIPPCQIIENELSYKDEFNFYNYHRIVNNTLIFFINTVIYTNDFKNKDGGPLLLDCAIEYYKEMGNLNTLNEFADYDEFIIKYLIDFYKSNNTTDKIKNIVIAGHHPIFSYRDKYEDGNFKPIRKSLDNRGLEFIDFIYNNFSDCEKFYLCADVHQYQKANIILGSNSIYQYVVGTGGTDCDEECPEVTGEKYTEFKKETTPLLKSFELLECKRSHGYQYCHIDLSGKLQCDFIATGECFNKKGGSKFRKKTKKLKTKKKKKTKKLPLKSNKRY